MAHQWINNDLFVPQENECLRTPGDGRDVSHNIEQKKESIREYRLYDSIYTGFEIG